MTFDAFPCARRRSLPSRLREIHSLRNRLRAASHATGHAPRPLSIPAPCHGCCLPSGTCDVRGEMRHPVRATPRKRVPSLPRGSLGNTSAAFPTKSQVPCGGNSRASSQAWLVGTRIPPRAHHPADPQSARPPSRGSRSARLTPDPPPPPLQERSAPRPLSTPSRRSLSLPFRLRVSRPPPVQAHLCPPLSQPAACVLRQCLLVCPRCSRISHDFKPPDFHPAGEWHSPDVDGVELAMAQMASSITEHACEY